MKNIRFFFRNVSFFLVVKFSVYLNRHVFVMICEISQCTTFNHKRTVMKEVYVLMAFWSYIARKPQTRSWWGSRHLVWGPNKRRAVKEGSNVINHNSVAQLDAPSDWRPGGRGFNPRRGRQHSFVEIDHEIFSTVILSLPLFQEGQLSVSGERMCTILVNRLED